MPQKFPLNLREEAVIRESRIVKPTTNAQEVEGFIYVPTIGLYVQEKKQLFGKNWNEALDGLKTKGMKAPTMEEFRQFLIYLKQNPTKENSRIYNNITRVREPYRAEWLDARFKKQGKGMTMFYHTFDENGQIVERSEQLSKYLNQNRVPGISLEKWLEEATSQGFPKEGIEDGQLYYWRPTSGAVAWFDADSVGANLLCDWNPTYSDAGLGVRGVMREAPKRANGGK